MSTTLKANASSTSAEITLPRVILNYISAANDGRLDDAAACFAEDALVHDESRDHRGLEAIRNWIRSSTREYRPKNEVLLATGGVDSHTVISRISGNFPGSPVELELRFVVTLGKISYLSIQ